MKLHLPIILRKLLLTSLALLCTTTQAGIMHEDVHLQTYTDFGQNKGRYVVGTSVNDLVGFIREKENGIGISYVDGTPTFYISLDQGMISFAGTGDGGPYAAIAPNSVVTVAHNGSVSASYGERVVGAEHAVNYKSIDIRGTGFRHTAMDDYMLQRQSKLQVDTTWNPLAMVTTPEEKANLMGEYVYHSGGGTMGVWSDNKEVGLCGAYAYIIGGMFVTNDMTIPENEDKFVARQNMFYGDAARAGASIETPLPNGIRGGDSGSPTYRYNESLQRYEFLGTYAVCSGPSNNWSLSIPQWTVDTLESFGKSVEFGSENTVYLNAVATQGEYIEKDGYSTTIWSGTVQIGDTEERVQFSGLKSGLNTWADLSGIKDTQNWYAYDADVYNPETNADGKLLQSVEDLFYTENLEFKAGSEAVNHIVLRDTVDLGVGYAGFEGGNFIISSESGENNVFNHAGYYVNEGATVHIQFTNPESYMTEWRKMGDGDLYIDGQGNTNALLNLGGTGRNYLQQQDGYAAYNVLVNTGATVVIADISQIKRDLTFGVGGGTLDMNGNDMDWYTTSDAENGFTINALTEEAVITNSSGHVALTYKESGTTTYLGSFLDTEQGSLVIDYQGGGKLSLHGIHTNLQNNSDSGFIVSNGEVELSGTNTVHGMGSRTGTNAQRAVVENDWHYADAAMDVTVKDGASFELGSHARLTGDVTVNEGGSFVMREGVQHRMEYVEGGVFLEDTYQYADFFGLKGNVKLAGAMRVEFSEGVDSRLTYNGNISGAGSLTVSLGTQGAILELGGDNTGFTGTKVIESGGVVLLGANSTGDTSANKWLVATDGWIANQSISSAQLLALVDEGSFGTLALSNDTTEQLDMSRHQGLTLGAETGKTVQYGEAGTQETLDAVQGAWRLGGAGGELVVNYKLSGENNLILGASSLSSGVVTLTNTQNDFSGDIIFTGKGIVLNAVDGALGNSELILSYGNGFGLTSADSITKNLGSASEGMVMVDAARDQQLDMSAHHSLAIAAENDVEFIGGITLSAGQGYLFSSAEGGKLNLLSELDASRALVVDAQGLNGGTVVLAGNNSWSGDITVRGHRDNNGQGEISLQLGRDVVLGGRLTLAQGGILDLAGHNLSITENISGNGGRLMNTGTSGELIFDCSAQGLTSSANLSVGTIRKTGSNILSLGGSNAPCRFFVEQGTLRLVSDDAFTAGSTVYLGDGTTLDNRTHALNADVQVVGGAATLTSSNHSHIVVRGNVSIADNSGLTMGGTSNTSITINGDLSVGADASLSILGQSGASYTIGGNINLTEGTNLSFVNSAIVTLNGENIGVSGSSLTMNGGRLHLNRRGGIALNGELILNGDVTIKSAGSADAMARDIESLQLNGGTLTLNEESWSTVWNINSLKGSGNLHWNSSTNHSSSSRLILNGDGDFSGSISMNRTYKNSNRTHGAFIELASDMVAAKADINLTGAEDNAVASLAINTDNAHIKGLSGNQHSFVYAGASRVQTDLSGDARPETTRAATLTIDADADYTFSGSIGNTTDTKENGISLVKTGNGTQTFDGASVVLNDVRALDGTLNISAETLTVNGNVELARGAALKLGDTFSLGAGQKLSVSIGEENSGYAVLNSALVLNGGSVSIDARGLSETSPLLVLGGIATVGENFGNSCQFDFSRTSGIVFGTDYMLSEGDWSLLNDRISGEANDYANATFKATSTGLGVVFSLKDGYLLWEGDERILQQDNKVVFKNNYNTVHLTESAELGEAYFDNSETISVNGEALHVGVLQKMDVGALEINSAVSVDSMVMKDTTTISGNGSLTVGSLEKQYAGALEINAAVSADSMVVNDSTIISGSGSLTVGDLSLQGDLTTRMAVQVNGNLLSNGMTWTVDGTDNVFTQRLTLPQFGTTGGMKVLGQATLELLVQDGTWDEPCYLTEVISGTGNVAFVGDGSLQKTQQEHINLSHAELANLVLKGGSTDIRGTVNITGRFGIGHENVRITEGAMVTAAYFRLGDTANEQPSMVTIEKGATLKITGNADSDNTGASFMLSHWKQSFSTLVLNGGSIISENARLHMGWDSGARFEALSGEATLKGIFFSSQRGNADTLVLGEARLNIGSGGITGIGTNDSVQLGNGTIAATADFSISGNKAIELVGTTKGTTFDTSSNTITVNTAINGNGILNKTGEGKLITAQKVQIGTFNVNSGTYEAKGEVDIDRLNVADGSVVTMYNSAAGAGADKKLGTVELGAGAVFQTNDRAQVEAATTLGCVQLNGSSATLQDVHHAGYMAIESLRLADNVNSAELILNKNAASTLSTVFELGANGAEAGNFVGTITLNELNNGSRRSAFIVISNEEIAKNAVISITDAQSDDATVGLGVNANQVTIAGLKSVSGDAAKLFSGTVGFKKEWNASLDTVGSAERTLTINTAENANHTFYGEVMGNLNLVKDGAGTQMLAGSSANFNGFIQVENGTLKLGSSALSMLDTASAVEVNGGRLELFLDSEAESDISGKKLTISNRAEEGTASLAATTSTGTGEYAIDRTDYQISNAHVTYTGGDATINNKLTNSSIENAGSGTLKVNNADNTLSGVYATSGNIKLFSAAVLDLKELEVATSLSVSAYSQLRERSEEEARINVSGVATFGTGVLVEADLVMKSGATLNIAGAVQMGSDVRLEKGLTLEGAVYDAVQTMKSGERVTLFTGVDALYLGSEQQAASAFTLSDGWHANEYFTNLSDNYFLIYDTSLGDGLGELSIGKVVPEPATATLSLLALAALAARRRRK